MELGINVEGVQKELDKSLNVEAGINVVGGINLINEEWRVDKSKISINVDGGFLWRVEFLKISKRGLHVY